MHLSESDRQPLEGAVSAASSAARRYARLIKASGQLCLVAEAIEYPLQMSGEGWPPAEPIAASVKLKQRMSVASARLV